MARRRGPTTEQGVLLGIAELLRGFIQGREARSDRQMRDREFDLGVRQEERIANTARAAELRKQEGAREKLNEELNTLWGEARAGKLPTRLQASPFATIGPERRRPGMLADAGPTLKAVAAKQEQAARLSKEGKGGGAGTLTERQVEEWNNLLFSGAFGQGGAGVRGMMERSLQLGAEGYSSLDEEGAQEELGRTLAEFLKERGIPNEPQIWKSAEAFILANQGALYDRPVPEGFRFSRLLPHGTTSALVTAIETRLQGDGGGSLSPEDEALLGGLR
jgi:hypothetical protein